MQNIELIFPEEIYSEHLATINEIKFTRREIDVIACLLNARGTSKIASLLAIALRTVVTHIRNIMLKLECNSREGIIDFIERSHKLSFLREYYVALTTEVAFEKSLKEVSKLKHEGNPSSLVIYWEDENQKQIVLTHLGAHLNLAGIKVEIREYDDASKLEFTEDSSVISLLFIKKELSFSHPKLEVLSSLDLTGFPSYYLSIFEILKKLLPKADINKIFATFQDHSEGLQDSYRGKIIQERVPEKLESKEIKYLNKILQIFQDRKWPLGVGIICISFLIIGCWILRGKEEQVIASPSHQVVYLKKDDSIRSDLVIPTESVLLNRPELISEIDNKLKSQKGIQTIALVGPGGAGKTTLARQYAHEQKASVIWEINAETIESLRSSFESLATALAKTKEDKNTLKEIQAIKNLEKREAKVIQFVKEHLNSYSNWFLVFDNVEKFSDIQQYFPQDFETWGKGKIILTTRNNNIQSNKHVTEILQIGELNSHQKIYLFTKIMNQGTKTPFTTIQSQEAEAFLENIPPFPLDISVAAYYLKAAQVPYTTYLENLNKYNKEFESVQENLLKEAGDYNKTRYGIITLSLRHIINAHKDFTELLLFISLLDSQNIPKDLLNLFKSGTVVDNFIYNLKRYSLITNQPSHISSTFSLHRSTQAIALAYLVKLLSLEKNKNFIEPIGTTFRNYASEAIDKEDFPQMNLLVRHWEMLLSHRNILTDFVVATISGELGNVNIHIGDYKKAKKLLEESIVIYRKNSFENPWFAKALACLASVYRERGDYEKGKQLFEESLRIYKKNSYENHPWFARALGCLGNVYVEQGDYKKAKKLLEKSIIIYRENLYENHPWFARALGCLGNVYREQANYTKAKQLIEESLIIYRKNAFETTPWFAWALGSLGSVYRELGNYKKAKYLLEESLVLYKKNSFENHPWFARTLAWLGCVYRDLNDYEKAKPFLEQSIVIYKKNSYETHPWFAQTLAWLGSIYRELGHYEKAKLLLEESLTLYRKNALENHPWFARTLEWLGSIYRDQGNYEKAKQLLEQSIVVYRENSLENHPWFARILGNLGDVYMLEGDLETAENLINRSLRIFQSHKHPEIYTCLESLAELNLKKSIFVANRRNTQQSKKLRAQAVSYLKQALNIVKTHFPKDSPHIARIEAKLKKLEEKAL